jgi:hypothetical protein
MGFDTTIRQQAERVRRRSRQHFYTSLLIFVAFPLLPLAFELIFDHTVKTTSMLVTAAIYLVSVAALSENIFLAAAYGLASFMFAAMYGWTASGARQAITSEFAVRSFVIVAVIVASMTHAIDRWKIHVKNNIPCVGFMDVI